MDMGAIHKYDFLQSCLPTELMDSQRTVGSYGSGFRSSPYVKIKEPSEHNASFAIHWIMLWNN